MSFAEGVNGFLNGVGGAFNSFMIGIIAWGLIFAVCGYFGYKWYLKKQMFKYVFILAGFNNQLITIKGRLIQNKNGIAKFVLKDYEDPKYHLNVREPNAIFNGKNVRLISFDGFGFFTYSDDFKFKEIDLDEEEKTTRIEKIIAFAESLGANINQTFFKKIKIDKEKYLETALTPVERSEAVDAVMESAEKGSIMNKLFKVVIGFCILLVIMTTISIVMVAKYNVESASISSKSAVQLKEAGKILQNTTANNVRSIDHNTMMLINFATSLGKNITFEVPTK